MYLPIISNGPFRFSGLPTMWGLVETAASHNVINNFKTTAQPANIFKQGSTFGVPKLDFNSDLITEMEDQAGQVVDKDCLIEFLPNGEYALSKMEAIEWKYRESSVAPWVFTTDEDNIPDNPFELAIANSATVSITNAINNIGDAKTHQDNIIFVKGTATVRGEVGGSVSVAASNSIKIDGDIIYSSRKSDPNPLSWADEEPEVQERLGLFATYKVMALPMKDTDLNIHASIFGTEPSDPSTSKYIRGFCVEDYSSDFGTPDINFYGSIVQNTRGAVGTTRGEGI